MTFPGYDRERRKQRRELKRWIWLDDWVNYVLPLLIVAIMFVFLVGR